MDAKSRREELPRLDERLADAVSRDMAAYMGEVMSSASFRPRSPGVHSVRTKQVLTRFGWCDVRQYSGARLRAPQGSRRVPRTLVVMSDGTNPPCTKADTAGVRGKNSEQAKSRQLRVVSACEYVNVAGKGVPIPIEGSFSYAVTDKGVGDLTSLIHEHAVSRGSGTAPRVQCVADGEEALEKAMRDALPFAEFTNDFTHATKSWASPTRRRNSGHAAPSSRS